MSKNKNLFKLFKSMSSESLDVLSLLDNLILTSEDCKNTCALLEISRKKLIKIFRKIEESRKILNLLD